MVRLWFLEQKMELMFKMLSARLYVLFAWSAEFKLYHSKCTFENFKYRGPFRITFWGVFLQGGGSTPPNIER